MPTNLFGQVAVAPFLDIQTEYRFQDREQGDLRLTLIRKIFSVILSYLVQLPGEHHRGVRTHLDPYQAVTPLRFRRFGPLWRHRR